MFIQSRQALKIYLYNVDLDTNFTNEFCLNLNEGYDRIS